MRGIIATLSCLCTIAATNPVHAQQATRLSQHNAWGSYSYQSDAGKVCYALSVPLPESKKPANLDHGKVYFFVSQKPGQNVAFEPQFIAGYDLQAESKVMLTIGERTFSMFSQGRSAWLENAAEEPLLVNAMRGGASMQVKATSGRGNATSYEFSLRGISAALTAINTCN
jgi:hypothetical protein